MKFHGAGALAVLGATFGVASGAALATRSSPSASGLDALVARAANMASLSSDQEQTHLLIYIFRPSDCRVTTGRFDTLSAIFETGASQVLGVMTDVAGGEVWARDFSASLGARFPIIADLNGEWAEWMRHIALAPPAYLQVEGPRLIFALPALAPHLGTLALAQAAGGATNLESAARTIRYQTSHRKFVDVGIRKFAGSRAENGVTLFRPELLAASGSAIYAYDYGDGALKAFSPFGSPLWSSAWQKAPRPIFSNPMYLDVHDGGVSVLDAPKRSVLTFDTAGRLVAEVKLDREVQRAVRTLPATMLGLDSPYEDVSGYVFDDAGKTLSSISLPEYARGKSVLQRESEMVLLPGRKQLVVAYRYSSLLALLDSAGRVVRTADGIEHVDFPALLSVPVAGGTAMRVSPAAVQAALSVASIGNRVLVLYGGRTADAGSIVDIYSGDALVYLGSFRLPVSATRIAVSGKRLVTLRQTESTDGVQIDIWQARIPQ